ncbi:MAG: FKBP-type peptidyl-prolyl cis-trans isomerase [Bacteroidales bacterium]|nr:FKBP-type peptidyl-prolyl cis-trans isomerase [Bacteroidales bacterium]
MHKTILYLSTILIILASCKDQQTFKKTDDGLEYLFIEENDNNEKPSYGDALVLDMKFYWNDSLLFNSREISIDYRLLLSEPKHEGSIYEGLAMMHLGDSAVFKIDAFSFYNSTAEIPSPDCIRKGDRLIFCVRLIDIQTPDELQIEYDRIKRMKLKNEQDLLKDYLNFNNITIEPEESGIYINEIKKGTGKSPEIGDSVTVHYEGVLINNEPFDSSIKRGKPFTFVFGDKSLIKGWTEGIGKMKEGGKAQIIIPSEMAYGENGAGDVIPPYSTVIFEVHLIKVKKN